MTKKFLPILLAALLSPFAQAVTVSNFDDWDQSPYGIAWGNDTVSNIQKFTVSGQTFATPDAVNTQLNSFSFWMRNLLGLGIMNYDFVIAEWSAVASKPIVEIHRSVSQEWISPPDATWTEVSLSGVDISLDSAKSYVAFLDATPYISEPNPLLLLQGTILNPVTYLDGGVVVAAPNDPSQVIDGVPYIDASGSYDYAFRAEFSSANLVSDNGNTIAIATLAFTLVFFAAYVARRSRLLAQ